jgi:hypothetical protein
MNMRRSKRRRSRGAELTAKKGRNKPGGSEVGQKRTQEKKLTLYKCYSWFLDNVSDDELKVRGCDVSMISTMHQIHDYISNGRKDRTRIKSGKITSTEIRKFERLYRGENTRQTSHVSSAYRLLIEGKTEAQIRNARFSQLEIDKAREFRAKYEHRDMLSAVVAKEMDIQPATAKRMQDIYRTLNHV